MMSDAAEGGHAPFDDATADGDRRDLKTILARYDGAIDTGHPLSPAHAAELVAMAGIFDLEPDRPPETLWPQVRAILVAQGPRVPDAVVASDGTGPLTLLIVEDDPHMAQDLTALMSEAGHAVIGPFHSAEAAEAAAGLHAIDLALLDINLSGPVDGATLGRSLRSRWGIKVIFLSGDVTAASRHADIAEAMVIKPYRGADVFDAIRRAVAGVSA